MTATEFMFLEKEEIKALLLKDGVYLYSRQEPKFTIDLYQINSFYIEIYNHFRDEKLTYLKVFSNCEQLQPYLDSIDVSALLD